MNVIPYDFRAAIIYAKRWAYGRNPNYFNFDGIGGDCTNFVSQCIYAGAGVMNQTPIYGWYYHSVSERSASWTGVEYLYNFLVQNQSFGPFGHNAMVSELIPGDVIQLGRGNGNFYHSLIVMETYPEILVAAHTDNALNRPLSSYQFNSIRFVHIDGIRK